MQIADARALEVSQEEKKTILQQLEQQLALYDAQGAYVIELQGQIQEQVCMRVAHCIYYNVAQNTLLPPCCVSPCLVCQRDVTAQEVAAHAATSMEVQNLQKQVQGPLTSSRHISPAAHP